MRMPRITLNLSRPHPVARVLYGAFLFGVLITAEFTRLEELILTALITAGLVVELVTNFRARRKTRS